MIPYLLLREDMKETLLLPFEKKSVIEQKIKGTKPDDIQRQTMEIRSK